MKPYLVRGHFLMKDRWMPFTQEIAAESSEEAVERVLSNLGSRHKVKRRFIKLEEVKELKVDEVKSAVVRYLVRGSDG
jgi:large subunit ribosomal protein LX